MATKVITVNTEVETYDANLKIEDDVDPTKILKFQVANLPVGTTTIDAATLGSGGLTVKTAARLATITTLPTYTYSNGSSGVGATLTATATGTLTIDSVLTALNNYILVKNETAGNAPYNGLYKVTTAGAAGVAYILTRSTDNDQTGEFVSALVTVSAGTTNANTSWVCNNASAPTVGTTNISFIAYVGGSAIHNNDIGKQGGTTGEYYHMTSAEYSGKVSLTGTETLTNKRVTKRAPTVTQSATPTINTDVTDVAHITGLAQAITSMTTNLSGTPVQGDVLRIDITDDGTGRTITWGASFSSSGTVTLPTTTVATTSLDVGFVWNTVTSKWMCIAVA